MAKDLDFSLYPTQFDFVMSDSVVVALIGPMGEGKTYSGVAGLITHAERCGRDIRAAIVRDTHQNIKTSTAPSIREVLGPHGTFKDDYKKLIIHSRPKVEVDLFGIDDPGALTKLQGPEYAIIWLEEPAPIIARCNAGLSEDVLNLAIARAARQKKTVPRVQVTMNPADEEHWTYIRLIEDDFIDEENPLITKEVFFIPYGENRSLSEISRQANRVAFKNRPELYQRYVGGQFSFVIEGEQVTPNYNPEFHRSKTDLIPVRGLPGFRFWDAWHNSSCVIGQLFPPNRMFIYDTLVGENKAMKQFVTSTIKPLLESPKYRGIITSWRDIGDPTMLTPDQSDKNRSVVRVLEEELSSNSYRFRFEPGAVKWLYRRESMHEAFERSPDGKPLVLLSKNEKILHKACRGGWFYKKDASGHVNRSEPEKNYYSHPGDAFSYGCSVLVPWKPRKKISKQSSKVLRKRARSYVSSYLPA